MATAMVVEAMAMAMAATTTAATASIRTEMAVIKTGTAATRSAQTAVVRPRVVATSAPPPMLAAVPMGRSATPRGQYRRAQRLSLRSLSLRVVRSRRAAVRSSPKPLPRLPRAMPWALQVVCSRPPRRLRRHNCLHNSHAHAPRRSLRETRALSGNNAISEGAGGWLTRTSAGACPD